MEKIKDLRDATSFWFFVLGFFYIAMILAVRNDFLASFFVSWMRILDLPFAFIAIFYGVTTLLLQLKFDANGEVKSTGWFLTISIGGMLLFGAVALMNFAFPATI